MACVLLPIGVANELVMGQEGQAAGAAAAGTEWTSWRPWIKHKTRETKKKIKINKSDPVWTQ